MLKRFLELFPLTPKRSERTEYLLAENKRLCKVSDLLDLFKEIRAILAEDTTEDYQLDFKREILQIVALMYIHLEESMSKEEKEKTAAELDAKFQAVMKEQEAHD